MSEWSATSLFAEPQRAESSSTVEERAAHQILVIRSHRSRPDHGSVDHSPNLSPVSTCICPEGVVLKLPLDLSSVEPGLGSGCATGTPLPCQNARRVRVARPP